MVNLSHLYHCLTKPLSSQPIRGLEVSRIFLLSSDWCRLNVSVSRQPPGQVNTTCQYGLGLRHFYKSVKWCNLSRNASAKKKISTWRNSEDQIHENIQYSGKKLVQSCCQKLKNVNYHKPRRGIKKTKCDNYHTNFGSLPYIDTDNMRLDGRNQEKTTP